MGFQLKIAMNLMKSKRAEVFNVSQNDIAVGQVAIVSPMSEKVCWDCVGCCQTEVEHFL